MEEHASLFTSDTTTPCDYNSTKVVPNSDTISQGKSKFNNGDALTFKDKYTALLQQELQNPYWCLHDPIMTKSYQISPEMDIKMMPHAMYFSDSIKAVTKINHVPYQTIEYDDKGMLQSKLMDDTQV